MANLAEFVFLNASSASTTSNTFYVPYGADEVVLQVKKSGTPSVTVQGKTDRDNGDWVNMAVIDRSDFSLSETIGANGIFSVDACGIREMRVVSGGTAGDTDVFGSAVGEG